MHAIGIIIHPLPSIPASMTCKHLWPLKVTDKMSSDLTSLEAAIRQLLVVTEKLSEQQKETQKNVETMWHRSSPPHQHCYASFVRNSCSILTFGLVPLLNPSRIEARTSFVLKSATCNLRKKAKIKPQDYQTYVERFQSMQGSAEKLSGYLQRGQQSSHRPQGNRGIYIIRFLRFLFPLILSTNSFIASSRCGMRVGRPSGRSYPSLTAPISWMSTGRATAELLGQKGAEKGIDGLLNYVCTPLPRGLFFRSFLSANGGFLLCTGRFHLADWTSTPCPDVHVQMSHPRRRTPLAPGSSLILPPLTT
jgi:hypothetical protein